MRYEQLYKEDGQEYQLELFKDHPSVSVDEYIGGRLAILGASGSGKSVTGATIMEELDAAGLIQVVIDTENDYSSLASYLPEQFDLHGKKASPYSKGISPADAKELVREVIDRRRSVILLLHQYSKKERVAIIKTFMKHLWLRMDFERPPIAVMLWIDEAHEFIPQNAKAADEEVLELVSEIAKRGRKRGLGLGILSQRPAEVNKSVLTQCELLFLHRVRYPTDIDVYAEILLLSESTQHNKHQVKRSVQRMRRGQCYYCFPTFNRGDTGQRLVQVRMRRSEHTSKTPGRKVLRR